MKKPEKSHAAPKNVDEYLSGVPEPARATLTKLRAVILSAVPRDAEEVISYRMPMYRYKGMLLGFSAFAKHCSLFPGSQAIEAFKKDLKDYQTSKGTIRFPMDKPPPAALVKKLVKARIAANERKKTGRK